jgi:uncharacterized repeat protein (TIGR02543 family)
MKKIFVVLALILCNVFSSDAQTWTPTTIHTPNGTTVPNVSVLVSQPAWTQSQIDAWKYEVAMYGATYLEDPTWAYNSHGYAWHMRQGGSNVRINTPGHSTYWTDGSYVAVSESQATHVVYTGGDHSAIRESQFVYVSKWRYGPKVRHAPFAVPPQYQALQTRTFYARATYTVSFNLNGAPGPIPPQTVVSGGFAIRPSPDPIRSGFIFDGWFTNSAGTGNPVDFASYPITSNQTFFAKWSQPPLRHVEIIYEFPFPVAGWQTPIFVDNVKLLINGGQKVVDLGNGKTQGPGNPSPWKVYFDVYLPQGDVITGTQQTVYVYALGGHYVPGSAYSNDFPATVSSSGASITLILSNF